MNGLLYLADGSLFQGKGFGKRGTSVGELVFNTSITGYQEILTDPSYAGQVITLTYPLIGNYGTNHFENESARVHARGLVVKCISADPSNYLSENTIDEMLSTMGIVGVCDVDTRAITRKIRDQGAMRCVISTEELSQTELKAHLARAIGENGTDFLGEVSTPQIVHHPGAGPKIAVLDLGVKSNIVENLKRRGCDVTLFPHNASADQIRAAQPAGLLVSNGPGDPKDAKAAIATVKTLMNEIPTFGICFGHQILALASGADTFKMKFGHRGGNHGVLDLESGKSYITAQNHGYAVDPASVTGDMIVTHINLNDQTVEGMRHKEKPVFSVQFHPEGAPGPEDTTHLFDDFLGSLT